MRRSTALIVLAAVVAACGDGNGSESRPGSTPPPVTSGTSAEPVPMTAVPSTPLVTAPPTSMLEPSEPARGDAVTFGAPDASLLPASPPDAVDWASVRPGWLLIDHLHGGMYSDPVTLDRRGLYLVSPDDVVYGVSALPTDGSRIVAVSQDARLVLLELYDPVCEDGCTCPGGALVTVENDQSDDREVQAHVYGYNLLDLSTTTSRPMLDPATVSVCEPGVFSRSVDFTIDGTAIWVSETWSTDEYRVEHVRLSRVEIASGTWTTILDEPVEVDEAAPPSTWAISVVDLDDGRIITATRAGTWLREPNGTPTRELAAPPTSCQLQRVWDSDHVLARCTVPPGAYPAPPEVPAEGCHTSGLWLLALDGSPAQPLAIPLDERGYLSCWAGHADAEPLDDWLAVQVGGDGCSDDVVVISPDGDATTWAPPDIPDSCTESLIGVRDATWLIAAIAEYGEGGIFEVTPDGSTRIDLPSGPIISL